MSNDTNAYAFGSGIAVGLIIGGIVMTTAVIVSGPVSPSKPSDHPVGTSTPTGSVQAYTAPLRAVQSPLHRDTFTATSIPGADNPFDVPCKSEGDNGCYWDAQTMGNGIGKSYVVTLDGDVYYLDESMSGK